MFGLFNEGGYSTNCFFKTAKFQVSALWWVGKKYEERSSFYLTRTYKQNTTKETKHELINQEMIQITIKALKISFE